MRDHGAPTTRQRLATPDRRDGAMARGNGTTERRLMALFGNVVLSQMLPDSAIKGGTGLKLRLGERLTRETLRVRVS